ncbi:MAG: phosphoribosyltransferase family protein, partial [Candidatus Woesearchaeota archaeon]
SSIANCISEEIRKKSKLNVDVGVIIASSYINMTKKDLEIKYIVPDKSKAANYDLILIVDDLVDTGTTIKRVLNSFEDSAREKIKTVVLDLKERTYKREEKLFPDYLRLKIKINSHKEEIWIVYDGELEGLTEKEIKSVYKNLYKKEKEDKVKDFERKSLH